MKQSLVRVRAVFVALVLLQIVPRASHAGASLASERLVIVVYDASSIITNSVSIGASREKLIAFLGYPEIIEAEGMDTNSLNYLYSWINVRITVTGNRVRQIFPIVKEPKDGDLIGDYLYLTVKSTGQLKRLISEQKDANVRIIQNRR